MTQETHKSLRLAFAVKDRSRFAHETEHQAKLRRIKASDEASILLEQQHALIVQMQAALETACDHLEIHKLHISHFNDMTQILEAKAAAKEYLK